MSKHRRPTRVQRAHVTTMRLAAALSVAGTIAFAFHSVVGKDEAVQAGSDVNSQQDNVPDTGSGSIAGDGSATQGPAPTASAQPKLLEDRTGDGDRTGSSSAHVRAAPPAAASTPRTTPADAPASLAHASKPVPAEFFSDSASSSSRHTPTAAASTPAKQREERQPEHRGGSVEELVNGVVKGLSSTAGGVSGGLLGG